MITFIGNSEIGKTHVRLWKSEAQLLLAWGGQWREVWKRFLGAGDVLYIYLSGRYIKVCMVLEIYQNVYTYNLYTFLYVDYKFLCVLGSVEFMQAQINITAKILE